VFVRSG